LEVFQSQTSQCIIKIMVIGRGRLNGLFKSTLNRNSTIRVYVPNFLSVFWVRPNDSE
jgi:hypothetical protein